MDSKTSFQKVSNNINNFIDQFKSGDYSNFSEFYNLTKKQVYFTAYAVLKKSQLAEDVMQDTYLSFLNNILDFEKGKNVFAYLTVIARNKSFNIYNKEKRISVNDELLKNTPAETHFDEGDEQIILNMLSNEIEREIVTYHVILGYKFHEIASILKIPLGTVLWRYNKALKTLKNKLGGMK